MWKSEYTPPAASHVLCFPRVVFVIVYCLCVCSSRLRQQSLDDSDEGGGEWVQEYDAGYQRCMVGAGVGWWAPKGHDGYWSRLLDARVTWLVLE